MGSPINKFAMFWNPKTKHGGIKLFVGPANQAIDVPVSSAEEFTAIAAILNESPFLLFPDGTISTQIEPPGGS